MKRYLNYMFRTTLLIAVTSFFNGALAQTHTDYLGAGHMNGVTISSSGGAAADNAANAVGLNPTDEDASRFLAHATFGANYETIQEVVDIGIEAWIDQQLLMPASYLLPETQAMWDASLANGSIVPGVDDYFGSYHGTKAWYNLILQQPDQLRHRVAYALSQLLVVSGQNDGLDNGFIIAHYYDILAQHAFGNYRDLLYDVTTSVQMGHYLSHLSNPKADPDANIHPDENYAREIMQLFTIGLYEMNMNGTLKLDANGELIPTYDNNDIKEFAQVFTGLAGDQPNEVNIWGVDFYTGIWGLDHNYPMIMYEDYHDTSEKILLNGTVLPAGQSGMQDINDALDHLFNHPNTAPFVSHKLIQRLVTSNPSPNYIERVANVFADNGSGVRGDLQAVTKAILMDPEARRCSERSNPVQGKLQEPLLRRTAFLRAFDPFNDENVFYADLWWYWDEINQLPFAPPTVFNFYKPGYTPPGPISQAGLVAPEFEIMYSATSVGYVNQAYAWTFWEAPLSVSIGYVDVETSLDMSDEEALIAAGDHAALVDRLDLLLCHGNMLESTKATIIQAMDEMNDPWNEWSKLPMAVYLTLISPEYVILK